MSKKPAFLTLLILLTASLALPQEARAQEVAELLEKLQPYVQQEIDKALKPSRGGK